MDINGAFKTTSKLLFGQEIGELADFDAYLREGLVGKQGKSIYSNSPIMLTSEQYCKSARFFDYNKEASEYQAREMSKPLDVNNIKDINSLMEAVGERLVYSGNKVLGNSDSVFNSDNVSDGYQVHDSSLIIKGKFVYASYLMNEPEYVFGCSSSGESSYLMRCFYNNTLKRCFECSLTVGSSDCYFTYNLTGAQDCMFSFNLRNVRNRIGNVQLPKEQYASLKKKLLSEMADELKRKKCMDLCIIDILNRDYDD
ncbi:MAG: hypothetical protein WCT31_02975 [Candidatus Micrarchaeia archaeon]